MDMRKLIDQTDFENLNELTRRWKKDSNASSLAQSQLSQRPETTQNNHNVSEQHPFKQNIYQQPQSEQLRITGQQPRKRQVLPQIIDEDTQHFRNRLEHLLNGFKTDAVSQFMSMKKAMLDYQKQSIKNDTQRYLTMYEEKHQELLTAKEKLGSLTAENQKKTMQIELMSSHIAKLNQRLKINQYLSRPFALLYQNKVTEKMIKVKMQQAANHDNRRTAIKGFNGWRNVYREAKKEQEATIVENRVQVEVRDVVGRFQKQIQMLKQKLNEATKKNMEYQKSMHVMQDNLKKAFLRGLSSMNMEAMNLFATTQQNQSFSSHLAESQPQHRKYPEETQSAYKITSNKSMVSENINPKENVSNVYVNKPKVESKDHRWKEAPIMGVEQKAETQQPRTHTIKPTMTEGKVIKIVDGKSSVEAISQKDVGKKIGMGNSVVSNKIEGSRRK